MRNKIIFFCHDIWGSENKKKCRWLREYEPSSLQFTWWKVPLLDIDGINNYELHYKVQSFK